MTIAIHETGHEIADTVAKSLLGFGGYLVQGQSPMPFADVHMGYGILRGMDNVMKKATHFFHIDRGYFNPRHFDGYYRISYNATQARYNPVFPITKEFNSEIKPIRKYDKSKPVLVCPPTDAVRDFFGISKWIAPIDCYCVERKKGDPSPINWDDYSAVITFNSSVGWQAIQQGIPCLSDPLHSVVGSYYNTKSIDELIERFNSMPREPLLMFMKSHDFTLAEIEQGKAWPLIQWYLSVGTAERRLQRMSAPIVSVGALKNHFQSAT